MQASLREEFEAGLGPVKDQEAEFNEIEDLVLNITYIITRLHKLSFAIRSPVPEIRPNDITIAEIPYFEYWDIQNVRERFCLVDPEGNFLVPKHLYVQLGKANTKRRQLLKCYNEAFTKNISRNIDNSLSKSNVEGNELLKYNSATKTPATTYTTTKSPIAVSTIKVEPSQEVKIEIERDEELCPLAATTTPEHYYTLTKIMTPMQESTLP